MRYTSAIIKKDLIRAWENGHVQGRLNAWSQEALSSHVQYAFPLLDRRLIELSFNIPGKYLFNKGYDRYTYRKAIEDIVPSTLLWGIHKSEPKRWLHVGEISLDNIAHIKQVLLKEKNTYITYKIIFREDIVQLMKVYYLIKSISKK